MQHGVFCLMVCVVVFVFVSLIGVFFALLPRLSLLEKYSLLSRTRGV